MGFRLPIHRRAPETTPQGIDIVAMKRRHLKAVVSIEQRIFPSPWSVALYLSELAQPASRAYFVARSDGEVIGYAGLMLAVGEGHVTTIGVSEDWQRRGIGRALLMKLARTAIERGAEDLTLEVRVSNTGAQALYQQFGFAPAGRRVGVAESAARRTWASTRRRRHVGSPSRALLGSPGPADVLPDG